MLLGRTALSCFAYDRRQTNLCRYGDEYANTTPIFSNSIQRKIVGIYFKLLMRQQKFLQYLKQGLAKYAPNLKCCFTRQ